MLEAPMFARMPGSDGALEAEAFDLGEAAGMRSAGIALLITAASTVLLALLGGGTTVISAVIDIVLGVQLCRLRHSWRAWAMIRALGGLAIGLLVLLGAVVTNRGLALVLVGVGQLAYCVSILMLLYRTPTLRRVVAGRVTFAVAFLLIFVGGLLYSGAQPEPEEGERIALNR